jgi:hypothetical protein
MSVANSEPTGGAGSGRWEPASTVRDSSRQQTAQPSLGLRGKRASRTVMPSKPERRQPGRGRFANHPPDWRALFPEGARAGRATEAHLAPRSPVRKAISNTWVRLLIKAKNV